MSVLWLFVVYGLVGYVLYRACVLVSAVLSYREYRRSFDAVWADSTALNNMGIGPVTFGEYYRDYVEGI